MQLRRHDNEIVWGANRLRPRGDPFKRPLLPGHRWDSASHIQQDIFIGSYWKKDTPILNRICTPKKRERYRSKNLAFLCATLRESRSEAPGSRLVNHAVSAILVVLRSSSLIDASTIPV
jgi:hypothetical protein